MDAVERRLERIEQKLDALIEALAEDGAGDEPVLHTLDGELAGGERDQGQSLG